MIDIFLSLLFVYVVIKILSYLRDTFHEIEEHEKELLLFQENEEAKKRLSGQESEERNRTIEEAKEWLSHLEIGTYVSIFVPPCRLKDVFTYEIKDDYSIIYCIDKDPRWSFIVKDETVTGIIIIE